MLPASHMNSTLDIVNTKQIPVKESAVTMQVNRVEPSAVQNTKDVVIMVHGRTSSASGKWAQRHGFTFRHAAGGDKREMPCV